MLIERVYIHKTLSGVPIENKIFQNETPQSLGDLPVLKKLCKAYVLCPIAEMQLRFTLVSILMIYKHYTHSRVKEKSA